MQFRVQPPLLDQVVRFIVTSKTLGSHINIDAATFSDVLMDSIKIHKSRIEQMCERTASYLRKAIRRDARKLLLRPISAIKKSLGNNSDVGKSLSSLSIDVLVCGGDKVLSCLLICLVSAGTFSDVQSAAASIEFFFPSSWVIVHVVK